MFPCINIFGIPNLLETYLKGPSKCKCNVKICDCYPRSLYQNSNQVENVAKAIKYIPFVYNETDYGSVLEICLWLGLPWLNYGFF